MGQDLSSAQLHESDVAAPVPADLAHEDGVPQSKPAADWLQGHLQHLKGLRAPSDQQALLIVLSEKPVRTDLEKRKFDALVKAERAQVRAREARKAAHKLMNAEKLEAAKALRKARDHEMFESAGLLVLAGLVDSKSGRPRHDRAELLGALLSLAQAIDKLPPEAPRRQEWKRAGEAFLLGRSAEH